MSASGDEGPGAEGESGKIKLDVGEGSATATAGDGGTQGCSKVDFLFVIDNSGSMGDEQQNLIDSFGGFISTIQTTLEEAQDYHIMVLDTDAWVYQGCENGFPTACDSLNADAQALCNTPSYQCGGGQTPEACDLLGAGVVHPKGVGSSEQDCQFTSGARYMDSSEPDLTAAFSCAALVGTGSTSTPEQPMGAMVQAVSPSAEAAACNEGFLRDDAILVVTFITDEDDNDGDGSTGTPEGWRQALVSAKGGNEDAIVVLGLFGDQDAPDGGICQDLSLPPLGNGEGAEPSPRLRAFVNSFGDQGFSGSVCAPSYADFFQQAVDIIDTTCDDFIPPG